MNDSKPPTDPRFDILYEDGQILVVNKPSGLLSVPGRGDHLADCMESRCQEKFPLARTVHRLDMDTSGVMVLAIGPEVHRSLNKLFADRAVEKHYAAWVTGEVAGTSGEIALPLSADWPNRPRQKVDPVSGKPSLTRWRVTARRAGSTALILSPVTGRTHQLRVHCAAIGHPVLGDRLYGSPEVRKMAPRLQLHAETLAFPHPVTSEPLSFHVPSSLTGPLERAVRENAP
ncbi:RluA family pseudouridine synthase [Sneathiella sp.]|uniref:RluA family pseudouridine synthase n=1 Tax=Sneathiella sp. TaxID=1964365 RepID=UPI00356A0F10